jgi:valyl-tRNA synthetase
MIAFRLEDRETLPIATTRLELSRPVWRYSSIRRTRERDLVGRQVIIPWEGRKVSILADAKADPQEGTGAVMCCTFGDSVDVEWWNIHHVPLFQAIDREVKMAAFAGDLEGLKTREAYQPFLYPCIRSR